MPSPVLSVIVIFCYLHIALCYILFNIQMWLYSKLRKLNLQEHLLAQSPSKTLEVLYVCIVLYIYNLGEFWFFSVLSKLHNFQGPTKPGYAPAYTILI